MNRAARLPALLALAMLSLSAHVAQAATAADSAKPAALPTRPAALQPSVKAVQAANAAVKAAPAPVKAAEATLKAAPEAVAPALKAAVQAVNPAPATAPAPATTAPAGTVKPAVPDTSKLAKVPVPQPPRPPDSVTARAFKIGARSFSREEAKYFLSVLNFKAKGKPESTAVNWIYRDERGALLTYEKGTSEWAYSYDTVAFLDPKEYLADSLIRTRTDGLIKDFLKGRSAQYSFVNYEVTYVQPRDEKSKEGVGPAVPAYYVGRYLRKLDGRFVLGDGFQVRIGVGRAYAPSFISFRDPVLTDSSTKVRIPSKELVGEYLAKWAKNSRRLGTRYYPFHPDKLRIKGLKPTKVFESYVLAQEKFRDNPAKDGYYLVPRVTVLAEVTLAKSTKRLKAPEPAGPVLLHFHIPCTPGAGLCWPDGKQGLEEGPVAGTGPQTPPPPRETAPPTTTKPPVPPGTN